MTDSTLNQRRLLRQTLRAKRRRLSAAAQKQAARQLCRQIRQQPWFLRCRRIAVYLANDGEISPDQLVCMAKKMGKQIYLPVLHPAHKGRLWFVRYQASTPMQKNRFGIAEPTLKGYGHLKGYRCPASLLDLVLMPLVGFTARGERLGMGGGFYDRTFEQNSAGFHRPLLIGLAHECQRVEHLPVADWDVPLAGILTPLHLYQVNKTL
ncbi:MAG: 5-formyltetrahydrofolate cyclo-ligase [Marinospirillum sp.]|uniref:5-formyltetrahydrofolate cyclo-ligase n=1 Tax=Marinospirillum sp. TaxID=2183934 RepID=UPI0019EF6380|nr:5-formyltetrahydrofolate cyclo-ligase [Marinospirillum sp.]MBE0505124.1 5-formyltetrahydrofolate cyclo-ligase [Marinospirillum sp.]